MKAESLFHLLQLRLSSLTPDCPAPCRSALADMQRHLRVTHSRNFFELSWRHQGKDYSLSVADREFGFHVAGDTELAVHRRGDATSTRARNWQSAAALWQRMAAISGLVVPDEVFPPALAPVPVGNAEPDLRRAALAVFGASIVVALIALLTAGFEAAIGVGISAALLGNFAWTMDQTHLRERLDLGGSAVLAVGALASLAVQWESLDMVPLLAGLAGATWLERRGDRHTALWAAAGAMAGCSGATFGWPGTLGALAFALAVLLAAWAVPQKLGRPLALAFAGAALATAIALATFGFWVTPPGGAAAWTTPAAWLITIGIVLPFLAWWVQGSLFRLLPWCGLGALSLAAIGATATSGATAGVLALAGLAALLSWRMGAGFLRSVWGR